MKLKSAAQMAELIGCSEKTFRKSVREQRLPFHKFGRLKRYDPAEILAVTKSQDAEAAATPKNKSCAAPEFWTDEDRKVASEIGLKI